MGGVIVMAVDQCHGECTAVSIIYKFSMPHGCCEQGLRSRIICFFLSAIPRYLQTLTAVEAADGQTALFTCHALDAHAVYWEINRYGQNHQKSKDLGVDVVTGGNSSIKYSNLTIPGNS